MSDGRELRWDDPVQNDGSDWVLLPEGEYPFRVGKFERKRFAGSAKLPACPQAVITIEVGNADTCTTLLQHNLYLHTKTEGLLCAFFRAIGQRKHGERMVMDWGKVVGATGRCIVGIREWTGRDGKTMQSNQVTRFLDPDDASEAAAPGAPASDPDDIPF